jgi:hypothetical protein
MSGSLWIGYQNKKKMGIVSRFRPEENCENTCFVYIRTWVKISAQRSTILTGFSWLSSCSPGKYEILANVIVNFELRYGNVAFNATVDF